MAKSNKPIVWGLFAAGGTVSAFVIPALVVVTLLAALGHAPAGLSYQAVHGFASHWLGKLVVFGVMFFSLWGSAHRLRITFYDFGVRADGLVATVVYLIAAAGSVATAMYLMQL
ncbi:MAG TPA: fumarate reductase subunit FrdD [Burkholderiales bacterium]|jgi:fumarate reductase subunit D|nr:fumarate reductase subunit FrdD [Burkholderiales bacterium]